MACGSINTNTGILIYHSEDKRVNEYSLSTFQDSQDVMVPAGSNFAGAKVRFATTGCSSSYTHYRAVICVDGACYDAGSQVVSASSGTITATVDGYGYGSAFTAGSRHSVYVCIDARVGASGAWTQVAKSYTVYVSARSMVSPSFSITNITRSPAGTIDVGKTVTVTATVKNSGGVGSGTVSWTKNGAAIRNEGVFLQAGETTYSYCTYTPTSADAGTTVKVCADVR